MVYNAIIPLFFNIRGGEWLIILFIIFLLMKWVVKCIRYFGEGLGYGKNEINKDIEVKEDKKKSL